MSPKLRTCSEHTRGRGKANTVHKAKKIICFWSNVRQYNIAFSVEHVQLCLWIFLVIFILLSYWPG